MIGPREFARRRIDAQEQAHASQGKSLTRLGRIIYGIASVPDWVLDCLDRPAMVINTARPLFTALNATSAVASVGLIGAEPISSAVLVGAITGLDEGERRLVRPFALDRIKKRNQLFASEGFVSSGIYLTAALLPRVMINCAGPMLVAEGLGAGANSTLYAVAGGVTITALVEFSDVISRSVDKKLSGY